MSALLEAPAKSNGHKRPTKSPREKSPLPATTSTTTPAGLEKRYGVHPVMAASIAEERLVELRLIHPHPDNRKLSDDDADVIELAGSLEADGLLQAITVRVAPEHWDLAAGHYQLVDGERRWRAARVAGLKTIRCKVREDLDDAATKRLLAVANAQRKDLNAIEKAQLIERLCTGNSDGSPPLTREQAAQTIGLETGAAASNLVRLLELPKEWQARVASGELPWTWARELLPVVKLEPVMEALDRDWNDREKSDPWDENAFISRKGLTDAIDNFVGSECRSINREHWAGGRYAKLKIDADDPQVRERFGIVEIELATGKRGKTETVLVATDTKAFDEALMHQAERGAKASADGEADEPKRELTAAEKREKTAARTKQRTDRIEAWRHKLLRREISRLIAEGRDNGLRVLLAFAVQPPHRGPGMRICLKQGVYLNLQNDWEYVRAFRREQQDERLAGVAQHMLSLETDDHRHPVFDTDVIEGLAGELGVDVAAAWAQLQATEEARRDLLEEFFLIHQTDELKELAGELGVHLLPSMSTRAKIVEFLLSVPQGTTRRLPLPKSIKPLPGVALKKRKGK